MRQIALLSRSESDGRITLICPGLGVVQHTLVTGQLVLPGSTLGTLSVLGREHLLIVPDGVHGVVTDLPSTSGAIASFGDAIVLLGEALSQSLEPIAAPSHIASSEQALVLRSTSSGRFYLRPSPDKPAFVSEGDEIEEGQTIYLLEVMKTFSRVAYGGKALPRHARVVRIAVEDGEDVEAGQIVLELEAIDS